MKAFNPQKLSVEGITRKLGQHPEYFSIKQDVVMENHTSLLEHPKKEENI